MRAHSGTSMSFVAMTQSCGGVGPCSVEPRASNFSPWISSISIIRALLKRQIFGPHPPRPVEPSSLCVRRPPADWRCLRYGPPCFGLLVVGKGERRKRTKGFWPLSACPSAAPAHLCPRITVPKPYLCPPGSLTWGMSHSLDLA